jgi:hypothetical protein
LLVVNTSASIAMALFLFLGLDVECRSMHLK